MNTLKLENVNVQELTVLETQKIDGGTIIPYGPIVTAVTAAVAGGYLVGKEVGEEIGHWIGKAIKYFS
ncbi:class IIb bacteriocin, lactobin A/cerein 7B family [Aquimarina sp. AU58]|uniref:class IIb bacteriocin, lactobin A/cerein 7B family n=1 Tax=Aquimarina sp. AU58 TaxID=1874112 RepID=UPI000D649419|nr:class IIb bacteriocin, lactobin A/cerein 7B family [Aquimarina sp. AU58]